MSRSKTGPASSLRANRDAAAGAATSSSAAAAAAVAAAAAAAAQACKMASVLGRPDEVAVFQKMLGLFQKTSLGRARVCLPNKRNHKKSTSTSIKSSERFSDCCSWKHFFHTRAWQGRSSTTCLYTPRLLHTFPSSAGDRRR